MCRQGSFDFGKSRMLRKEVNWCVLIWSLLIRKYDHNFFYLLKTEYKNHNCFLMIHSFMSQATSKGQSTSTILTLSRISCKKGSAYELRVLDIAWNKFVEAHVSIRFTNQTVNWSPRSVFGFANTSSSCH